MIFKNRKGQIMMYLMWFLMAVIIIVITAVVAPLGSLFNAEMYTMGEQIMTMSNESISSISNADVRESLLNSTDAAFDATENNIEVSTDLFQYAWIAVLFLSVIAVFVYSRRLVEFGHGGVF